MPWEPSGSTNFDRAAGFYDASRTHGPEVQAEVTALLGGELEGRGRCLEVGVGTGRVALPLHRAGIPMAGVDISPRMVERLVGKSGGRAPFPVALADATALPFGDGAFGATLAAHVLHLIPPWRHAVAELVRVVGPGAPVLVQVTGGWSRPFLDVRRRFIEAGGLGRTHIGVEGFEELDAAFADLGRQGRDLPVVLEHGEVRLGELLDSYERGEYSYTWRMDEATRHRAAAEARAWAAEHYGPLDEPVPNTHVIRWRVYEDPVRAPVGPSQPQPEGLA